MLRAAPGASRSAEARQKQGADGGVSPKFPVGMGATKAGRARFLSGIGRGGGRPGRLVPRGGSASGGPKALARPEPCARRGTGRRARSRRALRSCRGRPTLSLAAGVALRDCRAGEGCGAQGSPPVRVRIRGLHCLVTRSPAGDAPSGRPRRAASPGNRSGLAAKIVGRGEQAEESPPVGVVSGSRCRERRLGADSAAAWRGGRRRDACGRFCPGSRSGGGAPPRPLTALQAAAAAAGFPRPSSDGAGVRSVRFDRSAVGGALHRDAPPCPAPVRRRRRPGPGRWRLPGPCGRRRRCG